jgi:RecB family endonuclease NucS
MDFLKGFVLQSHDGNLKTSHYAKEYSDLRMKVSFGMGMSARVPWISFTAQGMSTSNGFYPVYLYYKDVNRLILSFGISETSEYSGNWSDEIQSSYPKVSEVIENPARYGASFAYRTYTTIIQNGSVIFLNDDKEIDSEAMSVDLNEILNIYKGLLDIEVRNENSVTSTGLFYLESQLEQFLIENWESTPLSKNLELIYADGELTSQQFRTDIGRIDLLVKDKKTGSHVVIELKRNQSSDDTVGQVLRYMGWVKEKMSDQNVRGIIVAGKYDEKLDYARKMVSGLEVFIYEVQFSLKEHVKN